MNTFIYHPDASLKNARTMNSMVHEGAGSFVENNMLVLS
jgi:hypothetical protein